MNARSPSELELLSRLPAVRGQRPFPLLFVHGAYAGAWCWEEHFLPYFGDLGYEAHALSLSGHGGSRDRRALDTYSIDDYVADVAETIDGLSEVPVLIGHSMGGMVLQKYLETRRAPGVVLLSSVPPQGLFGSAFGLALRKPGLMLELNRLLGGGRVDVDSLREALFHQPVEPEALMRYLRASQPESHRAIWDMTVFNLPNPLRVQKLPMLVLGAEHDQLIPPHLVELTARSYDVEAEILPGLGHGMMLERGWRAVAERIAAWLDEVAA